MSAPDDGRRDLRGQGHLSVLYHGIFDWHLNGQQMENQSNSVYVWIYWLALREMWPSALRTKIHM